LRIALDAFGGDNAPRANIDGAKLALKQALESGTESFEIALVGDGRQLEKFGLEPVSSQLSFIDIPRPKGRSPKSLPSIAENPESAIRTALRMHSQGDFDAVVSAGSTGAQVLASILELERCQGVSRPAIGAFIPTAGGNCLLIDVGASLVATPMHLLQFAIMGNVYFRELMGNPSPRIGLLNVAAEAYAGEHAAIEAHRGLSESRLNFVGFVEGRDVPAGKADVVVVSGLIGNVLLKYIEGLPALFSKFASISDSESLYRVIAEKLDFHTFGGEPLLGVNGVSIICHGASNERSVAAAIHQAVRISRMGLNRKIEDALKESADLVSIQHIKKAGFRRGLRPRR
jgi:glycerol-3-phosphate acyltransferase PlsX